MKLVYFSKHVKDRSVREMIDLAHGIGIDGYDLCVRPDYPVNPDNMTDALPRAVKELRKAEVEVPMVTAWGGLLDADDEKTLRLLKSMDSADVRLLKLGYFHFKRRCDNDYWSEVDRIGKALDRWQERSREFNIRLCYHTHSSIDSTCFMGANCGSLMHLLKGYDPECLGAYLDAGHISAEGEPFDLAMAMTGDYLCAVALKDVITVRDAETGKPVKNWVRAGCGTVDWELLFSELKRRDFRGPLSIHTEFPMDGPEDFEDALRHETQFYRRHL